MGTPERIFGKRSSGMRGLGRGDVCMGGRGDAGMRGGEKQKDQKEPFSASNEYKIQFPENQYIPRDEVCCFAL